MKVLYAVQATGNGHVSRAQQLLPLLMRRKGVTLEVLISGKQADLDLPILPKYQFWGLSFYFGNRGGILFLKTLFNSKPIAFLKAVWSLPVLEYDLVISDFEPISAWACKLRGVKALGLSHQVAVLHKSSPKPIFKEVLGMWVLKNYAPTPYNIGLHFQAYSANIYVPIIKKIFREAKVVKEDFYLVYLPAYADTFLITLLSKIPNVHWKVFSKKCTVSCQYKNVAVFPVQRLLFDQLMISCKGVLCGAGFETPAEALFLKKKLLVVPMKNQYEQQCNAAALSQMGVPVISVLRGSSLGELQKWVRSQKIVSVDYKDHQESLLDHVLQYASKS